jgi:hypothetical protein
MTAPRQGSNWGAQSEEFTSLVLTIFVLGGMGDLGDLEVMGVAATSMVLASHGGSHLLDCL